MISKNSLFLALCLLQTISLMQASAGSNAAPVKESTFAALISVRELSDSEKVTCLIQQNTALAQKNLRLAEKSLQSEQKALFYQTVALGVTASAIAFSMVSWFNRTTTK